MIYKEMLTASPFFIKNVYSPIFSMNVSLSIYLPNSILALITMVFRVHLIENFAFDD